MLPQTSPIWRRDPHPTASGKPGAVQAPLRGRLKVNAAVGVPTLHRNRQRADIIWTDEAIDRSIATATHLGRPQTADGLRLAALTELRRADLVTLTWAQGGEFAIHKRALKRSAGQRCRMVMSRIPALDGLSTELKSVIASWASILFS